MLFLLDAFTSKMEYAKPHDSTFGIKEDIQEKMYVILLLLLGYIVVRVWLSVRNDKRNQDK